MRPAAARRRRPREAGFTPVTAVLVFAAIALAAGIVLTLQVTMASSQGAQAQHGADAAALAGAGAVLEEIPADVAPGFVLPDEIPVQLGGSRCLRTGEVEADRLARENGDTLTSYCYDAFRDEIRVEVLNGDRQATAAATAATTFDAGACSLAGGLEPGSLDPGNSDDDPKDTSLDCGLASWRIAFNPADARFHFVDLAAELADVEPRLTR